MEMLPKYLKQFLAHNDTAYIPGLGVFNAENLKAEIDPTKKEMSPPIRTVHFKQQSSQDMSFIGFVSSIESQSDAKTSDQLKNWVANLKKEIVTKNKFAIEGIGILGLNAAKKVSFKPLDGLNLSPDNLGFKPVKVEIVKERTKVEAVKVENKETKKPEEKPKPVEVKKEVKTAEIKAKKTGKEKKNPMLLVILILVLLIAASGIGYYILKMNHKEEPVPVVLEEVALDTVKVVEPEPEPIPEPKPSITISEKQGRYYVIGNSFEFEENAYKFRDDVMSNGVEDSKIILPDSRVSLFRVSIAEFESQDMAIAKMEEMRSTFGNTIWVLTY